MQESVEGFLAFPDKRVRPSWYHSLHRPALNQNGVSMAVVPIQDPRGMTERITGLVTQDSDKC